MNLNLNLPCSINGCAIVVKARGMCRNHYLQWLRRHPEERGKPHVHTIPPSVTRLLARCVEGPGECWLFQGALNDGYATIRVDGKSNFGHRVTWAFFFGEIPEGLTFDHLCRVRNCVNPWHGDLVPIGVNVSRSPSAPCAINARRTQCVNGHPLSGENLGRRSNGNRYCKKCSVDNARRNQLLRAAKKVAA